MRSGYNSYVLDAQLENLTLLGPAVNGTGNLNANVLIGNAASNSLTGGGGDDTLDGGGGNDAMNGGQGNDTFVVDLADDTTTEGSGQGTGFIDRTLGSNIESLILLGAGNLTGSGNNLANRITGNAGNNVLTGAVGADTLVGGDGSDTYSYSSGHGADLIDNFGSDAALAQDRLIFTNQTLSNAQINALFPTGLTSTAAPEPVADLVLESALIRFQDAMNHFGVYEQVVSIEYNRRIMSSVPCRGWASIS